MTTIPGLELIETSVQMPLTPLPVRTTIVPVSGGRVMISPASTLTPEQLRGAGAVTDIVAPSLLHTRGIAAAAKVFPNARIWGPKGAAQKLPEIRWDGTLGVDAWPYEAELAAIPLEGMPEFHEIVFHHRASRSLIVSDLVFNITNPRGLGPWLIFTIFGTYKRFGVSRLFLKYAKDRDAFLGSIRKLLTLDFDRVVMGHGDVVLTNGQQRLREGFALRGITL